MIRNFAFFVVLSSLAVSSTVFARPGGGAGAATSALKQEGPKGLCTSDSENMNEKWVKDGWCQQIMETLLNEECAKEDFEKLQQKASQNQIEELDLYCSNVSSKANNKAEFAGVIQQMMAALAIEESTWQEDIAGPDITADGRIGSQIKPGEKTKNAIGLLQLETESIQQYACCKGMTDADLKDPKKSLKCGTHIAIQWMQKDGHVGGGTGNSGAKGAAQYFQPYREIDKEKRERMQNKVNKDYCERNAKPDQQSTQSQSSDGVQ